MSKLKACVQVLSVIAKQADLSQYVYAFIRMLQTPGLIGTHNMIEMLVIADSEVAGQEEYMSQQVSEEACNLFTLLTYPDFSSQLQDVIAMFTRQKEPAPVAMTQTEQLVSTGSSQGFRAQLNVLYASINELKPLLSSKGCIEMDRLLQQCDQVVQEIQLTCARYKALLTNSHLIAYKTGK